MGLFFPLSLDTGQVHPGLHFLSEEIIFSFLKPREWE